MRSVPPCPARRVRTARLVLPFLVLALTTCESAVTEDSATLLFIQFLATGAGPGRVIDEGRVRIAGPVSRTVTGAPGSSATIEGLPPGSYLVALEGLSAGEVEVYGETNGVPVTAGRNTTATVAVASFVPTLGALPAGALAGQPFTIQYSPVPGAASYVVEWATNPSFTNAQSVETPNTSASITTSAGGTVHVRVRAKNQFGALGRSSTGGTVPVEDAEAVLIHRYSFGESGGAGTQLMDAVGGKHGTIVDVGPMNATVGGGRVTLTGGDRTQADYVDLPDGLISGLSDATIELWATQVSPKLWSRIFDFGDSPFSYLMMSWSQGTDVQVDRVEWVVTRTDRLLATLDNAMAPYTPGREYHIVLTVDRMGPASSRVRVFRDGAYRGMLDAPFELSEIIDTNLWLGRSLYDGDETANAAYNELRIYRGVLTDAQILASFQQGPGGTAEPVVPMYGLYNTGIGTDGRLLGPDLRDPHYTLLTQPAPGGLLAATIPSDGTTAGEDDPDDYPIPPWTANTTTARWIGPDNADAENNALGPAGEFVYRTTFTIPGNVDPATVRLSGRWRTDNNGADIRINGVSLGIAQGDANGEPAQPFEIAAHLANGVNTLDFVVSNGGGPTGLLVDGLTVQHTGAQTGVIVTPPMARLGFNTASVRLQASRVDAGGAIVAGGTFTWSSSNSAVATVDATGLVRAVAAGTAVITATSTGEPSKKANAQITVENRFTEVRVQDGHTYALASPMSWLAARDLAWSFGGHLATIQTAAENQFIDQFPTLLEWIGLSDLATEGTFLWVDDAPLGFTAWGAGEPNSSGEEDCVNHQSVASWNDIRCDSELSGVVEWDFTFPIAIQDVATFGGHRYARTTVAMTWTQARDLAASLGGHLVKIESAAENDFLATRYPPTGVNFWIGLNDRAQEGTFRWADGTAPSYTNWQPGEPNENGGEDCTHFWVNQDGRWNDYSCGLAIFNFDTTPMFAIIEWDTI